MSKFRSSVASALSFAHLAGLNFKSAKADGEDPDEKDKNKGSKAEGEDPDEKDDKKEGRRAQRADESDEEYAEYNDDEDEKDDKKSAKSAKADDEDAEDEKKDDDEDEMRGNSAAASARRRERSRCAAIMGSKLAARNVVLAANLAFNTTMTRKQALAVLQDTPAASSPNQGRSARNPSLGAGGDQGPNSKAAITSSWDIAMQKARPSRSK